MTVYRMAYHYQQHTSSFTLVVHGTNCGSMATDSQTLRPTEAEAEALHPYCEHAGITDQVTG